MNIAGIKVRLHQFIDTIEDKKAEAIYTLFEYEMDTERLRKILIQQERKKYLNGEGASYSWETVKEMAVNKAKRSEL
ncbi:MAG: hypothetical protein H7257_00200 [Taibaiella sp.]|nr:hypothetical protein [Taibaiella sp.]